jgi:hypothetical protein
MKLRYAVLLLPLLLTGCASTGMSPIGAAQIKCDGPDFNQRDSHGRPVYSEEDMAKDAEVFLRMRGAKGAHQTRWYNGCLQTFVPIGGHDVMKFYDPNSYEEVALN